MRIALLDELRGLALINMVVYHILYDAVYVFGGEISWYGNSWSDIWQEYICLSFILISGTVFRFSKNPFRRAGIVIACALIISAVTYFVMPEQIIIFGILHCIGLSMLITALLQKFLKKIPGAAGVIICSALTLFTWNIFSDPPFYSSDYFPIFPYIFVFWIGYFLFGWVNNWPDSLKKTHIRSVAFIGRHTLLIYMIHQPMILAVLYFVFK